MWKNSNADQTTNSAPVGYAAKRAHLFSGTVYTTGATPNEISVKLDFNKTLYVKIYRV